MRLLKVLLVLALLPVSACRERAEKKPPAKKPAAASAGITNNPSAELEAFTGAHARLVWSKYTQAGESDTFGQSDGLMLMGLDSRDGLGERAIQPKPGNYSRPLLTCDGTGILYTDKNTVRKGGKKYYKPLIYLTGWNGGKPIRLAEGYAVDCWRDPVTGTEFVYAVQSLKPTRGLSLEGEKLLRFPLNDPSKVEVVYDDTPITPDNVQFSRDGTRACALFPWPHAGILRFADGKWTPKKLNVGCWTSLAPDNSGVGWSFDGQHTSVAMFAGDGAQTWAVKFNTVPGANGRELYHPRWSNHPRFIVLTGPYTKKKGQDGSVVNRGGGTAQVFLGRLSETADKVEGWIQITQDKHGECYPDAWIAGADQANLKGFSIPRTSDADPGLANAWPAKRDGLLFLWQDRTTLNAFTARDGGKHETFVESRDAARYGRFNEMLLDGGHFEAESESAAGAVQHLSGKPEASFEALVIPAGTEPKSLHTIFAGPGFIISMEDGRLFVAGSQGAPWKSTDAFPAQPFHLVVLRSVQAGQPEFTAHLDGEPLKLAALSGTVTMPAVETLAFGGGWSGGLLHVALYDRALTEEEITANAGAAHACIASFPAAPVRVKLSGRLAEVSSLPTPEGIAPYTNSLVAYVYEVEKVLGGELKDTRVLVKHWGMLDQKVVQGFPREMGKSYELILERESDHSHLKGERVMDDTTAFDLEAWFDVSPPRIVAGGK